jgi:ribosomal protein S18 acetylase RimI-like enzyme
VADLRIRPIRRGDTDRVASLLTSSWGSTIVVSCGVRHDAGRLPAFIAERHGEVVGLLTYAVDGDAMEVVTVDALERRVRVGSELLAAAVAAARARGLRRVRLVTTNDNLDALRFYQRRGMRISNVHRGAVDRARALKPSIPTVGEHGIEVHDEIELEFLL